MQWAKRLMPQNLSIVCVIANMFISSYGKYRIWLIRISVGCSRWCYRWVSPKDWIRCSGYFSICASRITPICRVRFACISSHCRFTLITLSIFNRSGPIVKFAVSVVTTIILANACHYCVLHVNLKSTHIVKTFLCDIAVFVNCRNPHLSGILRNCHFGRATTRSSSSQNRNYFRNSSILTSPSGVKDSLPSIDTLWPKWAYAFDPISDIFYIFYYYFFVFPDGGRLLHTYYNIHTILPIWRIKSKNNKSQS